MLKYLLMFCLVLSSSLAVAQTPSPVMIARPDAFKTLVNPNCSHCVDEAKRRSEELRPDDPVLSWTRGYSDGGAIPIRFFLNPFRVISDSYGVFVYDPDAGYARGFAPSYQFSFHGWRNGVMVMKHQDGTLYSCLTGLAFEGPRKGDRLTPVPTVLSSWGEWIKRYPHAVAYHMFDKYQPVELPTTDQADSVASRPAKTDLRLQSQDLVLGVRVEGITKAYPLAGKFQLLQDTLNGEPIVVLREGKSAAAYRCLATQPRKYKGPKPNQFGISPPDPGEPKPPGTLEQPARALTLRETASGIVDGQTGSTWDVAGRAIDGALKDWTLQPLDSVVCKWFAWSAENPQTQLAGVKPASSPGNTAQADKNQSMKMIAGSAEFLRVLPKPMALLKAIDVKSQTVTLLLDGEKIAKVWPVEPDAEIKVNGWWGRLEQFKSGDRVWVWLKLDRQKNPVSVCMLADEVSEYDCHGRFRESSSGTAIHLTPKEMENKRSDQKAWLRRRWETQGLPGTLTFQHIFSGELEMMLDHEAMRWGRSLREGDIVHISAEPSIKAVVKHVTPWRERTMLRLVVGELESSGLKPGQRLNLKMTTLTLELDEAPYPADLGRTRTIEERVEWFLSSTYCVCGIKGDICTGQFYTLASCNPNGCGSPNALRKELRQQIAKGKTDREIWDELVKDNGPLVLKPHLLP